MPTYTPVKEESKKEWIKWLESQVTVLNGKNEDKGQNFIFETPDGDVATGKDLVGTLLATITGQSISIN